MPLQLRKQSAASVTTPDVGHIVIFVDEDGVLMAKDSYGTVRPAGECESLEAAPKREKRSRKKTPGPDKNLWDHVRKEE